MRQFAIGILCSAAFLAACNKSHQGQAPESVNAGGEQVAAAGDEYYTVKADDIADSTITAVKGTFHMENATAADGIPSNGRGGACLAFRAKDLGFQAMEAKKCSTNSDCTVLPPADHTDPNDPLSYSYAPDPAHPERKEFRFGYCETQTKECWSKPIEGRDLVCNRPIIMTVGTVNAAAKNPPGPGAGPPIDVSKWLKQGDKVRVVACLQKTGAKPGPSPNGTGCASNDGPDRIEVLGKAIPMHK